MRPTPRRGRHRTTVRPVLPLTSLLLLRRLRELERHLPGAAAGSEKGVHQARVASRRLREAVPVVVPASKGSRKAARQVRGLTRALGTVREMDVTLGILDELARRPGMPRDAIEDVRVRVVAKRDRRRQVMLDRLRRVNLAKLGRRLEEVAIVLPGSDREAWKQLLLSRIRQRARRLAAAIDGAGRIYAPELLHEVRIAGKKLRYALELALDARMGAMGPLVGMLRRAQDTLGRLHDLQIIRHHVAVVQACPPARQGATDGGLDVLARTLEEECRYLHARYSAQLPALADLVATCRARVFPAGAAATRHRPPVTIVRARTVRAPAARQA